MPGQPGDPQTDVVRSMSSRPVVFSAPLEELERAVSKIVSATSVHTDLVASAVRQGVAMGIAILPLVYFGVELVFPFWFPFTIFETPWDVIALAILGLLGGWAFAEWLSSNSRVRALARAARTLRADVGGSTS
jgi:hypothetical protein